MRRFNPVVANMSAPYSFLLGVLSCWRITHLLQAEDGPWDVVATIRRAAGKSLLGDLLDCFYCLSLWISLPLAWLLGQSLEEKFLLWLALSGGAILLERVSANHDMQPAEDQHTAAFAEDPEEKEERQ